MLPEEELTSLDEESPLEVDEVDELVVDELEGVEVDPVAVEAVLLVDEVVPGMVAALTALKRPTPARAATAAP